MDALTIVWLTPFITHLSSFRVGMSDPTSSSPSLNKRVHIPPSPNLGGTVFPDEIMEEIISRLPAENLMEMLNVSQSWFATISDRYFSGIKHLSAMKTQNRVEFIFQSQMGFYPLGYEPNDPTEQGNRRSIMDGDPMWYTLASCNGFILNCTFDDHFFIGNPTLNEYLEFPTPKIVFPAGLTFASAFYGLGCVPGTDEYKIIRIVLFNTLAYKTEVQCYSTYTREWKHLGEFPYEYPVWSPGVFVGGCINWQISTMVKIESIASFCCRSETWRLINLPPGRQRIAAYGEVCCLDDDKLAIYSSICYSFEDCELWILEDFSDDTSWRRLVFAPGYLVDEDEFVIAVQPLYFLRPDRRMLLARLEPSGHMVEYDLIDKVYIPVNGPVWYQNCCSVFPFTQCIARVA